MAGATSQQTTTGQESAAHPTPPQPPLHPMVTGGSYMPPPSPMTAQSMTPRKSADLPVKISNLSLVSITFSLMLLGIFTFLGGFFLGMWMSGPSTPYVAGPRMEQLQPSPYDLPAGPTYTAPQDDGVRQALAKGAGQSAQYAVTEKTIPGVPSFLQPLVRATQTAGGRQLGRETQSTVERYTHPSTSSRPTTPSTKRPQKEAPRSSLRPTVPSIPSTPPSKTAPPAPTATPHTPGVAAPPTTPSAPTKAPSTLPSPQTKPTAPLSHKSQASPHEAEGNYSIQLGVFATKENADDLVSRLQGINYVSQVTEGKGSDGSHIYYVHSGAYKDYTQAQEAASQFVSRGIPGAIVVDVSSKNKKSS